MELLIKGATVIDPRNRLHRVMDVAVDHGVITGVHPQIDAALAERVIDATGMVAAPGFVDMHVHLRDPGQTHKEDILSGCEAAAAGGVTSVICMPNTNPPVDSEEIISYIYDKAAGAKAKVYPAATITRGMRGTELGDFSQLMAAGAIAVTDDGRPVENARLMQECMELCAALRLPVISHCEDLGIIDGGIINKGVVSADLGVKGMDRSSEDSVTAREIALAEATGSAIHIAHVSTKGSVRTIRDAKRRGVRVTCETAPHYFLLTDRELRSRDANLRMNPPLRERADVAEIIAGLVDGTIDAIVTDHAPHTEEEKADFLTAPNGVVGMETSFAASYTALVDTGILSLDHLVRLMSLNPAKIMKLGDNSLREGNPADIVIFDPKERWTVDREKLHGKSKNTPFHGRTFTGKVKMTILGGNVVFTDHNWGR
ncbi:dihydroorotase [Zongyangia hominis]|uniref:Dihydroorotase n=1 Tax=Zongyangia hominis TaxID=2763677 RepID=A0A926I7E2_9FIRM|nr:dihydroorotase [Zongyangia hominis]MBC8571004.1 dihydroorotase [Zongyangia hominis]